MGKKNCPVTHGHAAGKRKNGQELGLENEAKLLECIQKQGWVRELEAALLCKMSEYSVGIVSTRLKKKGWITRKREHGNAGFFLRLTPAGADRMNCKFKEVAITSDWAHDSEAIQTLDYLSKMYKCEFITETVMRRGRRTGKFPDGKLIAGMIRFYFEQERARKSGKKCLGKQVETMVRLAKEGYICFVAYPYPPAICDGVNHETRQTNAIRRKWGSPDAPNIRLVRCIFDSRLAYHNMRVSRFEILELPPMVNTADSRKPRAEVTEQVMGFKWRTRGISEPGMPQWTEATLTHNGVVKFKGVFKEGADMDDAHVLEVDGWQEDASYDPDLSFVDFIRRNQKRIEREIEEEMRSRGLQHD